MHEYVCVIFVFFFLVLKMLDGLCHDVLNKHLIYTILVLRYLLLY